MTSDCVLRVRGIETILVEKGYIETAALDRIIELYETQIGTQVMEGWNFLLAVQAA